MESYKNPEEDRGETIGSYAEKMRLAKLKEEKGELEKYKPTPEEEQVIEYLVTPIFDKIKELQNEIKGLPQGPEREAYESGIGTLLKKWKLIKYPQGMTIKNIEDLILEADIRRTNYEGVKGYLNKIKALNTEIDFLLDKLIKRIIKK